MGNPFKCDQEVLSLHTMNPPKRSDIFSPDWGMLGRSIDAFRFFFQRQPLFQRYVSVAILLEYFFLVSSLSSFSTRVHTVAITQDQTKPATLRMLVRGLTNCTNVTNIELSWATNFYCINRTSPVVYDNRTQSRL